MQAVLVTNQIFAGSLGADALAAAAIGFTVSCPVLSIYDTAFLLADTRFMSDAYRVQSTRKLLVLILYIPCSSSTCAGTSSLVWDLPSTHVRDRLNPTCSSMAALQVLSICKVQRWEHVV